MKEPSGRAEDVSGCDLRRRNSLPPRLDWSHTTLGADRGTTRTDAMDFSPVNSGSPPVDMLFLFQSLIVPNVIETNRYWDNPGEAGDRTVGEAGAPPRRYATRTGRGGPIPMKYPD